MRVRYDRRQGEVTVSEKRWKKVSEGLYRRGSCLAIDFHAHGRRVYKRLGPVTVTTARGILAELRGNLARRIAGVRDLPVTQTVEDVLGARLEDRKVRVDVKTYVRYGEHSRRLIPFFAKADLRTISIEDITRYQRERLKSGASAKTINNETTFLRSALRGSVRAGKLDRDPLEGMEKLPETEPDEYVKIFADSEIERMRAAAPAWFGRFILIALKTACRAGELATLRLSDVDLAAHTLTFRSTTVKGRRGKRKTRVVPLVPSILGTVEKQVEEADRRGSDFLFSAPRDASRPVMIHTVSEAWSQTRRKAGLRGRLHDLRHTAITRMISAGLDAIIVRRIVGHTSTRMIDQRYSHMVPTDAAAALRGLDAGEMSRTIPAPLQIEGGKEEVKSVH